MNNKEFLWGKVIEVYEIRQYKIIKYSEEETSRIMYHIEGTHNSYHSLDTALIGAICNKHLEPDEARYATKFMKRMLNII